MNFFAHACVASVRSQAPRFLLGAMLPDLVGMLGQRIAALQDTHVRAGVEHHHAADAAFHASSHFGQLCADAVETLTHAGVARGSARAVGHVGVELLLDGVLSHDVASRNRYSTALRQAVAEDATRWVQLRDPSASAALRDGIARLIDAPVPEGYRDPDFVTARLERILRPRPRLALREADLAPVRSWVRKAQPRVLDLHARWLAEVTATLDASEFSLHADPLGAAQTTSGMM